MTTYGWYYEDGSVQDVCSSEHMWRLLGRAVEDACADDALPKLRFGPEVPLRVSDLLDEDDIQSMIEDERLTPEDICEVVDERAGEMVEDGTAHLSGSYSEAFERVALGTPAEILAWAVEHIELDPDTYYSGRYPLPIEYVDGGWTWGRHDEDAEAAAVITYATEPSPETGHVGWCWWALGQMGEAKTLPDAMAACGAHIRAITRCSRCAGYAAEAAKLAAERVDARNELRKLRALLDTCEQQARDDERGRVLAAVAGALGEVRVGRSPGVDQLLATLRAGRMPGSET